MYTENNYTYICTNIILLYSYTSMYTKYKYKHHTLIQVCILNINTRI